MTGACCDKRQFKGNRSLDGRFPIRVSKVNCAARSKQVYIEWLEATVLLKCSYEGRDAQTQTKPGTKIDLHTPLI
jgi:hypothetical protein